MSTGASVGVVRAAARLTLSSETAAMRFLPRRYGAVANLAETFENQGHERAAGVLRGVASIGRRVREARGDAEIGGECGGADFRQQRFQYEHAGSGLILFTPDREYIGGPDEWQMGSTDPSLLDAWEPLWLLALIDGIVEAVEDGTELILGERCARYRGVASLSEAETRSSHHFERPRADDNQDLEHLPLLVWIDDAGRVRKADLQIGRAHMLIELSDFDVPGPVELPDPSLVWTAENDGNA